VIGRCLALLLWAGAGIAKTLALVWLITAPDALWPRAVAALLLAWSLVGVAILLRQRIATP
jgi:hypothetical protein